MSLQDFLNRQWGKNPSDCPHSAVLFLPSNMDLEKAKALAEQLRKTEGIPLPLPKGRLPEHLQPSTEWVVEVEVCDTEELIALIRLNIAPIQCIFAVPGGFLICYQCKSQEAASSILDQADEALAKPKKCDPPKEENCVSTCPPPFPYELEPVSAMSRYEFYFLVACHALIGFAGAEAVDMVQKGDFSTGHNLAVHMMQNAKYNQK